LTAGFFDLVDDCLGGAGIDAGAIEARADVADDDAGAFLRQQERDATPDAATRPGDNRDFACNDVRHSKSPFFNR
jgi:hypothetical protein